MELACLGMLVAAWGGLLAQIDPNTTSSWIGGVAALTLLTVAIGFNVKQYRSQARDIKQLHLDRAKDLRSCNWQISVLAEVLENHRIPMPANFWNVPEDPILQIHEKEQENARRSRMSRYDNRENERGAVAFSIIGITLLVCAFFAVLLTMAHFLIIQPISDIKEEQSQEAVDRRVAACNDSLTADYFVAINRALQAPPAPNLERQSAGVDLSVTAERIRDREMICSDGIPNSYRQNSS